MKILVFGKTGQVAQELQRRGNVIALGREQADFTQPETCLAALKAHAPDAAINAVADTAADQAEEEEALAHQINAEAPGALAQACARRGIPFVHISTDYVFDGSGSHPWRESDPTAPQNAYGRSKLAGEHAVAAAGGTHAILRTAWVFSSHGSNFVRTMLRLAESRDALSIVDDQIGGPTPAAAIADACLSIATMLRAQPERTGIYHFSGAPEVSWKEFAEAIFARTGRKMQIEGIPSAAYPTPASRPANSRLDCTEIERAFSIRRPDWRPALDEVLAELAAGS
ncbi:MAG TPA: dTDP-4-dehydrorhamnose reductase [Aliiroseovarius sp.]|nr:dTDP-4-dehydrorhamnose reductase [Aliiroseovarius sp.]